MVRVLVAFATSSRAIGSKPLNLIAGILVMFMSTSVARGAVAVDLDAAIAEYRIAITSNSTAVLEEAIATLSLSLRQHPEDPRLLTCMGSLTAKLAKVSWLPWSKVLHLKNGIELMDRGVDTALRTQVDSGTLIEVRMVRGITSARMPSVFQRGQTAMDDFSSIRNDSGFGKMTAEHQSTVLAYTAVLEHRAGNRSVAEDLISKARKIDKGVASKIWSEK